MYANQVGIHANIPGEFKVDTRYTQIWQRNILRKSYFLFHFFGSWKIYENFIFCIKKKNYFFFTSHLRNLFLVKLTPNIFLLILMGTHSTSQEYSTKEWSIGDKRKGYNTVLTRFTKELSFWWYKYGTVKTNKICYNRRGYNFFWCIESEIDFVSIPIRALWNKSTINVFDFGWRRIFLPLLRQLWFFKYLTVPNNARKLICVVIDQ